MLARRHEPTGQTLRQWYEDIERQTGVRAAQLDGPELPEAGWRVWGWYRDLDAKRGWLIGMGAAAPAPITWAEIGAYFQLIGQQPQPWQVRLLADLDALYRATISGENTEQADSAKGLGAVVKAQ